MPDNVRHCKNQGVSTVLQLVGQYKLSDMLGRSNRLIHTSRRVGIELNENYQQKLNNLSTSRSTSLVKEEHVITPE